MTPTQPPGLRADERGIYVASRASDPTRPAMWRKLRAEGWPIVSSWIDEAGAGETASLSELWSRIDREIRASSGVIVYAEADDFPLKGAYIEAGIALGAGLPVAVVLPGVELAPRSDRPIGSWIRHPRVSICATLEEARAALTHPAVAMPDEVAYLFTDVQSGDTEASTDPDHKPRHA